MDMEILEGLRVYPVRMSRFYECLLCPRRQWTPLPHFPQESFPQSNHTSAFVKRRREGEKQKKIRKLF